MTSEALREKIAEKLCYLAGATTPFSKLPSEVKKDWYIDADAILSIIKQGIEEAEPKDSTQKSIRYPEYIEGINKGYNKGKAEYKSNLLQMVEGKKI